MNEIIVIPTRGRWNLTLTCDRMPKAWRKKIVIVCPHSEAQKHADIRPWATVLAQPDKDMTIAAKRAWIMEYFNTSREKCKIVMFDDDLQFFVKRNDNPKKLRQSTELDVDHYLKEIFAKLSKDVPHAGFGSRLFNNNKEPGWHGPARMQYVLGYYLPVVVGACELGRIETREDMDYTLQLLRAGYTNEVCESFVVEQANGYAANGGCSGQRTTESSDRDAERLAELHPGYVRVVLKQYKNHPRKEVACRWAAALADGKKRREAESGSAQARTGRKKAG